MRSLWCAGLLSPPDTRAVVGQALVARTAIARCPSAALIGKLGNKGLLLTGPGIFTSHLGTTQRGLRERASERGRAQAWGSAFSGGEGRGWGFESSFSTGDYKSGNLNIYMYYINIYYVNI